MNGTGVARVAKICALLAFFLPWALVQCSGQPVATLTGASLAIGDMAMKDPMSGVMEHHHSSPNLFLILALGAIVVGLTLSFMGDAKENPKDTAKILFIGAASALALCILGLTTVYGGRDQAISKAQSDNQFSGVGAGMVQIKTEYGFWVTLVALAVAAGSSGLIVTDRETLLDTLGGEARRFATATIKDEDERFWDRMPDKNDSDALEEYLHRFPNGKFVSLARTRLERSGTAYADIRSSAPQTPPGAPMQTGSPNVFCPACGAPSAPDDRFCGGCGAGLTT